MVLYGTVLVTTYVAIYQCFVLLVVRHAEYPEPGLADLVALGKHDEPETAREVCKVYN